MSTTRDRKWSRAYGRQASADYAAYVALARSAGIAQCAPLHFLQMTCEKLVKAYLYATGAASPYTQTSHAYTAKVLPVVLRRAHARLTVHRLHLNQKRPNPWLFREIQRLAREIELLAPAVDDGGSRPDNCEYPWADVAGRIRVPAEHEFVAFNNPAGVEIMKLLPIAIGDACEMD